MESTPLSQMGYPNPDAIYFTSRSSATKHQFDENKKYESSQRNLASNTQESHQTHIMEQYNSPNEPSPENDKLQENTQIKSANEFGLKFFVLILKSVLFISLNFIFWAYIYIYGIGSKSRTLTFISIIFAPIGFIILILVSLIWKERKLKCNLFYIIKMTNAMLINSILGVSEIFITLYSPKAIGCLLFPIKATHVALQISSICLNTETWGNLPIAYLVLGSIQLICCPIEFMINYYVDNDSVLNNKKFDQFDLIYEGSSKAILNWIDVGTDLIYIFTSEFSYQILFVLSIVFLFTASFIQAVVHYKQSEKSMSAFIKAYVSSFLGIYEAEIGYELLKQSNPNLDRYFSCSSLTHALTESLPQLCIAFTNSLLLGKLTVIFFISSSVSIFVITKTIVTQIFQVKNVLNTPIPALNIRFGEYILMVLIATCWNVNLAYLDYCNDTHFIMAICLSCLIILFLSMPYIMMAFKTPAAIFGIIFVLMYHAPINLNTNIHFKLACFTYYIWFKNFPMLAFLISNSVCNEYINPLSAITMVLLFLELLLQIANVCSKKQKVLT